jgi:nicotinamide mononucleotide (NMN) deamidase PncC
VAVSITGIAGPSGGLPGKPVGLVFIALSARDKERVERFVWDSDREGNKARSAEAALAMLKEFLESNKRG